jgi:hypothetical protein
MKQRSGVCWVCSSSPANPISTRARPLQFSVNEQQMSSACDNIIRGNLGNKFLLYVWFLQNLFRAPSSSPCSARAPFSSIDTTSLLRYFNKIKTRHFYAAATPPQMSFPNAPHHKIAVLLLRASPSFFISQELPISTETSNECRRQNCCFTFTSISILHQ